MVATIAAIGTLLGGVSAAAGAFGRSNAQPEQSHAIQEQGLQDARNNEAFQRALSVLINQRSVAGSQDSFGSTLRYDPATNQWVSNLGPLPQAEQTAASQASISRNTTDLRTAQGANEAAVKRANQASPLYDTAIRNLQDFRPTSSAELAGLLTQQGTTANNTVMRPIIADTLRNFARSGTAAGPVLAKLGQQSYENLKDALVTGRMQALNSTDTINNTRRQGLESAATTAGGLANPSLQFSGLSSSDQAKNLASLLASRAQTASTAPATGQFGVNQAAGLSQAALQKVAGSVPDPNANLNSALTGVKELASTLQNKESIGNILSLFSKKPFDPAGGLINQPGTSPGFGDQQFNSGGVF